MFSNKRTKLYSISVIRKIKIQCRCNFIYMEDITKRFIEFYDYIKNENIIKDASAFAKSIGVSNSLITEIKKERSKLSTKVIQNLVKYYNLNTEWLFTGKGEIIKKNESAISENLLISQKKIMRLEKQIDDLLETNKSLSKTNESLSKMKKMFVTNTEENKFF